MYRFDHSFFVSIIALGLTALVTACSPNPGGGGAFIDGGGESTVDARNAVPDASPPGGCTPRTCAQLGKSCGAVADGCGGLIECGTCTAPETCGGGGTPNVCGNGSSCIPTTCEAEGAECGPIGDGCGGFIESCGTCEAPSICGGGGQPSVCGGEVSNPGDCTGLCEHQVACPDGGATTLTGTVFAPNGTLPLYNAVVYVPNGELPPIPTGVSCDRCEDEDLGSPLVSALSASDGTFTLRHVPANVPFPLVIKMGKWRRQVTIPAVEACGTTALTAEQTRLPKNQGEGDIPLMAMSTGSIDPMECLLRKIGLDDSEFTRPGGSGRVRMYRFNGGWPDEAAKRCNDCSSSSCRTQWCGGSTTGHRNAVLNEINVSSLYASQTTLDGHDMVVFACERQLNERSATIDGRFREHVNAGGRAFLSHWSFHWIHDRSPLSSTATWDGVLNGTNSDPITALVDASFPKGSSLVEWLDHVGASHQESGRLQIHEPRTHARTVQGSGRQWVYTTQADHNYASVQQLSFNTPVDQPEEEQCGRVVYSGFHVVAPQSGSSFNTSNDWFPRYCSTGDLTPQEKVLAFMLFDLAACISDDSREPPAPPTCEPRSCADVGAQCGYIADGCGGLVQCDTCPDGEVCGVGGPNQCGPSCQPSSCASLGAECGTVPDGCGGTLACGTCPGGFGCSAANKCLPQVD